MDRDLERKVQQLKALIDFGRVLAGTTEPDDVLMRLGLTLAGQLALRTWALVAVREGRPPLVRHRGMPWLEQEWGAVLVMDMFSNFPYTLIDTSSEESMFHDLARRNLMDVPMIRQAG